MTFVERFCLETSPVMSTVSKGQIKTEHSGYGNSKNTRQTSEIYGDRRNPDFLGYILDVFICAFRLYRLARNFDLPDRKEIKADILFYSFGVAVCSRL